MFIYFVLDSEHSGECVLYNVIFFFLHHFESIRTPNFKSPFFGKKKGSTGGTVGTVVKLSIPPSF